MQPLKLLNELEKALKETVEGKFKTHVQIQQTLNHFKQKIEQESKPNEEQDHGG